jgi:hypothetical protein
VVVDAHEPIIGIPNRRVSSKPKSPDPKKTANSHEFVNSIGMSAAAAAWYKIAIGPVVETKTTRKPDKSAVQEAALGSLRRLCASALNTGKSVVPVSISDITSRIY